MSVLSDLGVKMIMPESQLLSSALCFNHRNGVRCERKGVTHTVSVKVGPCAPRDPRRLQQQKTVDACKVDPSLKRNVSYAASLAGLIAS